MTEARAIVERYSAASGAGDAEAALACVHPDEIAAEHAAMMRHDPARLVRALDAAVFDRADITGLLTNIRVPADVLSGELDRATPPALGEEIAAGVVEGRHLLVPEVSHHLPIEAPNILPHVLSG